MFPPSVLFANEFKESATVDLATVVPPETHTDEYDYYSDSDLDTESEFGSTEDNDSRSDAPGESEGKFSISDQVHDGPEVSILNQLPGKPSVFEQELTFDSCSIVFPLLIKMIPLRVQQQWFRYSNFRLPIGWAG